MIEQMPKKLANSGDGSEKCASAQSGAPGSPGREGALLLADRIRDLEHLLTELVGLYESQLEVLQRKLAAMRCSDVQTIQSCVAREGELVKTISSREGLRRRLMVLIGQDLGWNENESRNMTISRLTQHVEGKRKLGLLVQARRLAGLLKDVSSVNEVASLFAGRMLEHYRYIFGQITQGIADSPVYVPEGDQPHEVGAQVFDATA